MGPTGPSVGDVSRCAWTLLSFSRTFMGPFSSQIGASSRISLLELGQGPYPREHIGAGGERKSEGFLLASNHFAKLKALGG